MSAEILRRAAALMRERAEAATPGPWETVTRWDRAIAQSGGQRVAECTAVGAATQPNAAHIASWHPAVALAVADWLEYAAMATNALGRHHKLALAVARVYLGGDS